MKTRLFLIALILPVICSSQTSIDSTMIKNKLMIEGLKNRINTIDNIGNENNTYQKQIDELKVELSRQNDSIFKLLSIINELKNYSVANPSLSRKTLSLNAKEELLTDTKSLKDNDYNTLKKAENVTQDYILSCNCSPLFYKPYQIELNFKTITDLNEIIKNYESNPTKKIVILGHADKSGNEAKNINLSKQRAENLKSYLIIASDKIKKEDIIVEWHGSSKPIPNLSKNKNELNRRTEILIK
ncbi:MAG: OmpA family protein [Bacteroidota bacterium]